MARDILGDYGPESRQPQAARATNGGQMPTRDVRNYCPPQGPININDPKGPGLHGANYGNCGTQAKSSVSVGVGGSVGLHGTNSGVKGTQR